MEGEARPVVLKLMKVKGQFLRELATRKNKFDSAYVIDVYTSYPQISEEEESEIRMSEIDIWPEEVRGIDINALSKKQISKDQAERLFWVVFLTN